MSVFIPGHDYSQLGERGIRGLFRDSLESSLGAGWARRVGWYFQSDSASETHRWLGQVAALRQWVGARIRKGTRIETFTIANVPYEDTLPINVVDLRRDKTGQLRAHGAAGLGVRANEHWDSLASALLVANPLCYDGQNLFDTDHSSGSSGTQTNALTSTDVPALNVGNTLAITADEALDIVLGVCPYFYSYLDDQGEPANGGAQDFLFVVPWRMLAPFTAAINRLTTGAGGQSPLGVQSFRAAVVSNPRFTSQLVGYVFRMDANMSSGLILQEEIPPTFESLDEGSEYAKLNGEILQMVKASRACGAGQWRHVIRFTVN